MKTWRFTRILSVILVLAMLIQMLPVQTFAETTSASAAVDVAEGQAEVTVLGEVEELREEDTKHFRLSDGSFVAVSYGLPVHYEDENGDWQDIDNSLTMEASTDTYQLDHSDVAVAFSHSLADGTVLTASKGNVSISMALLDTEQADQMISGDVDVELPVNEVPAENEATEALETEETVPETFPEETEDAVAEETVPAEATEEASAAEDSSEDAAADAESALSVAVEMDDSAEVEAVTEDGEADAENSAALISDNASGEEAFSETTVEETEAVETEAAETEEPEAPTEESTVEETTSSTVPQETVPATQPEETIAETTAETEPQETAEEDELSDVGVAYNREATAQIT